MVMFNENVAHEETYEEDVDYILQTSIPVAQILNEDSSIKQQFNNDDVTLTITGTDLKSNYLKIWIYENYSVTLQYQRIKVTNN